jgi:DNA-binding NarL/FixJ family response regulator
MAENLFLTKKKMKIKVVVTEDNKMLALSIKEKLELFPGDIRYVHTAVNGRDLLDYLTENAAVDVILMDIEMPVMDGIAAAEQVKQKYPHIKIIMLTVIDDEEKIFQAITAGASGYLLKDETPAKLIEGITMIMNGGAPMSPTIAFKALHLLRQPLPAQEQRAGATYSLSPRETEVLEQLSKGLDYTRIAENLFVSPSTVRKHIENIYKELQVHNKVEAVQKAIKHRII